MALGIAALFTFDRCSHLVAEGFLAAQTSGHRAFVPLLRLASNHPDDHRSSQRCRLPEKRLVSPGELLNALKRYLAESGDTEEAVASQIGVNHHTLRRWLSDKQSPKKCKLALAATFLRHAEYL